MRRVVSWSLRLLLIPVGRVLAMLLRFHDWLHEHDHDHAVMLPTWSGWMHPMPLLQPNPVLSLRAGLSPFVTPLRKN